MKRGSLFFAAFLLVGGILRFAGPGAASSTGDQAAAKPENAAAKPRLKTAYPSVLAETIDQFFGLQTPDVAGESPTTGDLPASTAAAIRNNEVQFAIAILPDPAHTRLGLFFDRSIESIQQGAEAKGYVFDRAIMPWSRTSKQGSGDLKTRQEEAQVKVQREAFPGLMIFRPGKAPQALPQNRPLFVLVVGETPTAGLNKAQFRNAIGMVRATRPETMSPGDVRSPLLIMGPTFSGSLQSLEQELRDEGLRNTHGEAFIYSGTVTASGAILQFQDATKGFAHFASFQENDDYTRARFLQFAADRGYKPYEIAVLSEDETVYGSLQPDCQEVQLAPPLPANGGTGSKKKSKVSASQPKDCTEKTSFRAADEAVLKLHFPREISYFRSEYQKEAAAQTPSPAKLSSTATLPMDLDEDGGEDDSVSPYAMAQTGFSQEAVMLGIVSELQKHHIKFTVVLASDPIDDLFLAGYLRKAYAQGQVVITVPDLLFAREGDPSLRGILSLNTYSLIPGLSDRLCRQKEWADWHQDRLFVSSGNIGAFNATVGLLSQLESQRSGAAAAIGNPSAQNASAPPEPGLPYAPYAEYGSPSLSGPGTISCEERPLLWLTMLGRDGFWPIVGLTYNDLKSSDGEVPVAFFSREQQPESTLLMGIGSYTLLKPPDSEELKPRTPSAWNIAYTLCLILLVLHAILSWSGSILADSEARAQFTRTTDTRGTIVLGIGTLALASAFVLVMCTRSPLIDWAGSRTVPLWLWLAYPIFVGVTIFDFWILRRKRAVAILFAVAILIATLFQLWLTWCSRGPLRVYWSTRMLYLTSGVSPVLPVLLLMAAAYWWMWISLRGVCLVDLRRPRLPRQCDLPTDAYRVSDKEGEQLREAAHPFVFEWRVLIPVLVLAGVLLTVLDLGHPVQTIEGRPFDWGYTILLGLLIGTFLGCLLKLVNTWLKCRQVLAGLDRLPLRAAFTRIHDLSWHSFWNPGGSTLRETYKVMERALENLTHLLGLVENWNTPMADSARVTARKQIRRTLAVREELIDAYGRLVAKHNQPLRCESQTPSIRERIAAAAKAIWSVLSSPRKSKRDFLLNDFRKGCHLKLLMRRVEFLQKEMAHTAAVMLRQILEPMWEEDKELSVSTDERLKKSSLPLYRAMMEEYCALIYVNFLVSVLLRIRTLVICAGGMYVLIVLSLNTYPFQPRPALQTLTVVLLLVMAVAVGYVYAEMHREAILSRLTDTKPGELGLDFWIKFLSAGALPVFSLLAAQFPSITQFLFAWLEPALQAMK